LKKEGCWGGSNVVESQDHAEKKPAKLTKEDVQTLVMMQQFEKIGKQADKDIKINPDHKYYLNYSKED